MSTTLDIWVSSGSLQRHQTSPEEIANILGIVERDIADSQTPGLSADCRLTIAYNAALQAARAALAASGYRVSGSEKGHHYRMIESLRHTVEPPAADVDLLQRMKKKRNQSDYEVAGAVTEREAEEMLELAQSIHQKVREWLAANHPDKVSS
ncbi:MAG: HEPN domain-containing protein [candidate division WOR-3 bacterium]|nr:MAG: HEPN domain-containing protein [candidate division WOR-3 bacterium]